ncbi:MAG TPA: tetratricopeptide repeat protein [Longimicrobiales bacterium]|nr:tetratricopeptide repeat protein [Longimicrobiales bacterium]
MAETHRDDIAKLETLYAENPAGRVFIHLAEAYRRSGELDRALGVLEDGISRYPEDSSAQVVLGRVFQDQQQDEEASEAFRRVLELDAHNLVALRGLGDLAYRAGRRAAALAYYERLAELEPPDDELEGLIEGLQSGAIEPGHAEPPAPPASPEAAPGAGAAATVDRSEEWSGPQAVDFAGGSLGPGGTGEAGPGAGAAEAVPDERAATDEIAPAEGEVPEDAMVEPPVTPAGEVPAAEEPVAEEPWTSAATSSVETAGAGAEPPEASPEPPVGGLEGLETEGELRGAEGMEQVEELEVTETDFREASAVDADALPEVGGMEGLETAGSVPQGAPSGVESYAPPRAWTDPGGDEAEDEDVEVAPTVFTETMARVYARQGLYDRAADVYRELLRQRPGDAGLAARLAEMEEQERQAGALAGGADAGAGAESGAEEAAEPFEPETPATSAYEEATPAAPYEEDAPEGVEAEAGEQEAEPLPFLDDLPVSQPGEAREPTTAPGAASEEEGVWDASTESAEAVEAVWTGAGGAVAGEETPYSWTEPEEERRAAGEAIRSYLQRLTGWAPGVVSAAPSPADALEAPSPEADAPDAPASSEPAEEDDDLNMFRAWLESLKR